MKEQGIDNIISAPKVMANKIGIHPDFADKSKRKAKRAPLEEAEESNLLTPVNDFQRQSNTVFDSILTQLQWRFEMMSKISSNFYFLSGESFLSLTVERLKICSATLTKIYNNDLDATEFMSEVESFKFQGESLMTNFKNATPIEILQLIHTYALKDIY